MYSRLNRLIVESSVLFVSIFATIGLLIGATSNEVKTTFVYLGYMLYYSLPFILASCFSIVSILSEDDYPDASEGASVLGTAFFITGLAMLTFLASLAAQTSLLPTTYAYLAPYPAVPFAEFMTFVIVLMTIVIGSRIVIPKLRLLRRNRNWLFAIFSALFVLTIVIMSMFGVQLIRQTAKSEFISLSGSPDYSYTSVNMPLEMVDQVVVRVNSSENRYFSYVFVDAVNYELYKNDSTRLDARPIKYDNYRSDSSFTTVIEASGVYYLMIKSEYFLGTNVTYSLEVFRPDNSVLVVAFFGSAFCFSVVVATVSSKTNECPYVV